jgi:hypothetical protein
MITDTHYPDARRKARAQLGGASIALWLLGFGALVVAMATTSIYVDEVGKAKRNCEGRDYSTDKYWSSYDECYRPSVSGNRDFALAAVVTWLLGGAAVGLGIYIFRREPKFMRVLRERPQDVVWVYEQPVALSRNGVVIRTTYVACIALVDKTLETLDLGVKSADCDAEIALAAARVPRATVGFSDERMAQFARDPRSLLAGS